MKLFHCFVQTYIQTPLRFVSKDEDDKEEEEEEETAQAESKKKIRTLRHLTTELALLQLLIDYA